MTTIETCGHRLLVVPVPGDATQFEFPDFGMLPIKSGFKIKCTFGEEHDPVAVHEYVVLGTCTAQGPAFDAGPYLPAEESTVMWKGCSAKVELVKPDFIVLDYSFGSSTDLKYGKRYIEEFGTDHRFSVSAKDWLLSLLAANGVHFQNPLGEEPRPLTKQDAKPDHEYNFHMYQEYKHELQAWQEAQAKVVEKVAVILIK